MHKIDIGSFEQKASATILVIFYSSVLLITALTYYIEKSSEVERMIFPVDNIVQYLEY
jgi:hypothetical protein